MRLMGIIDFTMGKFLCVRGFMLELSEISKADENIQRDLIEDHKGDMEAFLSDGKFTFFPEVILGANMKGSDSDIDKINYFREEIRAEKGLKKTVINGIKYMIKRNAIKKRIMICLTMLYRRLLWSLISHQLLEKNFLELMEIIV